MSALLGGLLGGLCGYLYLTEDGRTVRARVEPFLDDFSDEMRHLRHTVDKARVAAQEGLDSLHEVTGATSQRSSASAWPAASRESSG